MSVEEIVVVGVLGFIGYLIVGAVTITTLSAVRARHLHDHYPCVSYWFLFPIWPFIALGVFWFPVKWFGKGMIWWAKKLDPEFRGWYNNL